MNTLMELPKSILTKNQKLKFPAVVYHENGEALRIIATVRHDDECGNGHNSFSITADIDRKNKNNKWLKYAGGCCHEKIAKHFPALAPLIKWHLCSTDEPMHYLANTLYHAGIKDCNGKIKGEPYDYRNSIKFKTFPLIFNDFGYRGQNFIKWLVEQKANGQPFNYMAIEHKNDKDKYPYKPKFTFYGFKCEWHECPFDSIEEAAAMAEAFNTLEWQVMSIPTSWGKGKEPDLEAARHSAIWPDADLASLQSKEALLTRLPSLMQAFKRDVESLGLTY